jgi:sulfur carrier protein
MSNQRVEVIVNGEPQKIDKGSTIAGVLAALGLPEDRVAVELNRQIVRRPLWESTLVEDGAHLEIVQFVGGG